MSQRIEKRANKFLSLFASMRLVLLFIINFVCIGYTASVLYVAFDTSAYMLGVFMILASLSGMSISIEKYKYEIRNEGKPKKTVKGLVSKIIYGKENNFDTNQNRTLLLHFTNIVMTQSTVVFTMIYVLVNPDYDIGFFNFVICVITIVIGFNIDLIVGQGFANVLEDERVENATRSSSTNSGTTTNAADQGNV